MKLFKLLINKKLFEFVLGPECKALNPQQATVLMEIEDFLYDFCSDHNLDYDGVSKKYLRGTKVKVRSTCTALTKSGECCKRTCNFGSDRCPIHGGCLNSGYVVQVNTTLDQVIDRIARDYKIDRLLLRKRYFEPPVVERNDCETDSEFIEAAERWLEMELA